MNRSIASMNIILHALEDHVEKSWIREDDRISLTGCALLDTIGSPVQPDTLYICTPQTLTADLLAHGINAVCCGMPNAPETAIGPRTSLIVVKDVTLELTANKVISFFASQSQLFFDLGNAALAKHDPENLIQIAAGYSGLALALLDINQSIVARSMQSAQIDNPLWETITRDDLRLRAEIMDGWIKNTSGQSFDRHAIRSTTVVRHPVLERNIYRKNQLVATLWAFKTNPNSPFAKYQIQLFSQLSEFICAWAEGTTDLAVGRGRGYEPFIIDLIQGAFSDENECQAAALRLNLNLAHRPEYQLIVFDSSRDPLRYEQYLELMDKIEDTISDSICAFYDEHVVVLLPALRSGFLEPGAERHIRDLCSIYHSSAVISAGYFLLESTPAVYQQILDALMVIHYPLMLEDSVNTLSDNSSEPADQFFYYHTLTVWQGKMRLVQVQPWETMCHPMVRTVVRYDAVHETDYLVTLRAYLANRCNIAYTAKLLNMHRNTLLYRIKKIEELVGTDFEDWRLRRLLLFSIDYYNFAESISLDTLKRLTSGDYPEVEDDE